MDDLPSDSMSKNIYPSEYVQRLLDAQNLMAAWQEEHDSNDFVAITNKVKIDTEESLFRYLSFFPDAIDLLCRAIEKGSFYKPIHVNVNRTNNVRAVLHAVHKKGLTNITRLALSENNREDGACEEERRILSQCIENGNLEHLEHLRLDYYSNIDLNSRILSAVATGRAPNLETIEFYQDCDVSAQEKMARAIADGKLRKLRYLVGDFALKENREILRIPEEIADKGSRDILAFLHERWQYGEVQLATAKVIVTGPTSVGKTCLVHCLKGSAFSPDPGSTNAIEIGKVTVDGGLVLFYHDFGGQRVYTISQGWFLQTPAVFLVAWDRLDETGGDSARDQYARDVLDANPNAKLIFVTTKGDLEGQTPLSVAEQAELKERYGNSFHGYYDVSAKANTGVKELLAAIKSAAGFANILMPKTFDNLRKSLTDLRENTNQWYVTRKEWDELCESVDISGDERSSLALRLFRDMGEVVRLSTGHLVVKPWVLVDVLSRIVTADERYKDNTRGGYLRHDEIEEVWLDYPKELREGFLKLIHDCDIGFPVSDETHDFKATLIPAMMVESSVKDIEQGLKQLGSDFPAFEVGSRVVVELSNLSNQLWAKLLVKMRGVVVLGGWSPKRCIVIDMDDAGVSKAVRCYGEVSWDSKRCQVSVSTHGRSKDDVQLLRSRTLNALGATLKDFPGVSIERLCFTSTTDDNRSEEWSRESLTQSTLDTTTFEKHDAPDIAEWVLKLKESGQTPGESSFGYFMEMLHEKSGASQELLSYLLLSHQSEILKKGCERGRLDLSALWLIYDTKGGRTAYPLCPHLHPKRIRVNRDMEVSGVSDIDLQRLNGHQEALKSLTAKLTERLRIRPPRFKAEFLGIVWHDCDEEYAFDIHHETTRNFQPVTVDGFEVYVHESDQLYFTNQSQANAIKKLTQQAKKAIHGTRKDGKIDKHEPIPDCNEVQGRTKNTLLKLRDFGEKDVGELSLDTVEDPQGKWPMSSSHYVFLSHTGQDNVKAEIARPTHWFLTNVVGVQAFLDESDAAHGSTKMEVLMPPAHTCTHALVILSPSFRQRRFCVMELNTFMERWRRRDGICVLPALWLMDSLKGYHPDVNDLIRIGSSSTRYPVDYMVKILWPALLRELGRPAMTTEVLESHLVKCVESTRGGIHEIPSFLETFVTRKHSQPGPH